MRGANDDTVYAVPVEDAPAAVTSVQVYGSAEDTVDGAMVVAAGREARAAPSSTTVYATPIEDTPAERSVEYFFDYFSHNWLIYLYSLWTQKFHTTKEWDEPMFCLMLIANEIIHILF